ncbi:MAG: metallophosphoesterase [Acidimicrobiia bacterium]|nr:metallophosphoesterase [Acidimicrobiia bacterium]
MKFEFIFMTDCQLGAYATFSGLSEAEVAELASRDMRAEVVPKVDGFEWDANQYATAIAAANSLRPDFVVMGGDMVDDPGSEDQLNSLLRITSKLDQDIPMRWVPGNHDIGADTVVPTRHSIDKYREAFGPDYYSFDYRDTRFIVLDTVVIDSPQDVPGELDAQMEFLESELDRARAHQKRVVLFGHHPLFVRDAGEEDTYWNLPIARRRPILDLIHRSGVKHAFAGHWHRNAIAFDGDFEMVTSGPVGYPLGRDPSGFRTVVVGETGLQHTYLPLEEFS